MTGDKYPKDGILSWRTSNNQPVAVFRTPADARAAINRTDHYRQAFGTTDPEKRFCRVTPIATVPEGEALGFDRPPRRFGMEPLWGSEITHSSHTKSVS